MENARKFRCTFKTVERMCAETFEFFPCVRQKFGSGKHEVLLFADFDLSCFKSGRITCTYTYTHKLLKVKMKSFQKNTPNFGRFQKNNPQTFFCSKIAERHSICRKIGSKIQKLFALSVCGPMSNLGEFFLENFGDFRFSRKPP